MASYLELFALRSNSDLQDKCAVAVAKKAQALLDGAAPTAAAVAWAKEAIGNPKAKADALINYVLAKNSALTKAQIAGATDEAIQANIGAAVDVLISGGA